MGQCLRRNPVAIPGCGKLFHKSFFPGKTWISLALAHIFGFGHAMMSMLKKPDRCAVDFPLDALMRMFRLGINDDNLVSTRIHFYFPAPLTFSS
jgi:hypothetical protein